MVFLLEQKNIIIFVASFLGLLMAVGIGANDVANAMGTSVGSRAVTVKQAIIIAAIFEFAGALLASGEVTQTIRNDIVRMSYFNTQPMLLIYGMMAALSSSAVWLIVASWAGWPVSTTHSVIGGIIGFSSISVGISAVSWDKVEYIVLSWLLTPLVAGVISYTVFISTQKVIFDTEKPFINAKRYGPMYIFLTVFVLSWVTLSKGLKHISLTCGVGSAISLSTVVALLVSVGSYWYIAKANFSAKFGKDNFSSVEQVFRRLMLVTACAMAFAHGSNDVANAIGPLSAVISAVQNNQTVQSNAVLSWWILALGGMGIVLGLVLLGYKVMATVGTGITDLTPSRGFTAEFSAAFTVVLASGLGLPISTTQTLVGAVLGVGFARGIAALNLGVIRNIIISWVITLPLSALLSICFFYFFRYFFQTG